MPGEWCEHPGLGGVLFEIPLWCILHYTFGTSAPHALAAIMPCTKQMVVFFEDCAYQRVRS